MCRQLRLGFAVQTEARGLCDEFEVEVVLGLRVESRGAQTPAFSLTTSAKAV